MKLKPYLPMVGIGEQPFVYLNPPPQEIQRHGSETIDLTNKTLSVTTIPALKKYKDFLLKDLKEFGFKCSPNAGKFKIKFEVKDLGLVREGYELEIKKNSVEITGQSAAGVFYGIQTFLQIAAFEQETVPLLKIRDWPTFSFRSVMIDMGRAVFPMPLIKRVIRIMARLKLNVLHLHLYDDQLMAIRFKKLPLGKENPHAIAVSKLAEIVQYAKQYHVQICPELESWAHVGTILHHYPELYGGPGKWGGVSLGIGQKTFDLLEKIYEEVVPHLDTESAIHLGLDEAIWSVFPDMKNNPEANPSWFVGKLHEIVTRIGRKHGKKLTVHIWADHGGRPLPEQLKKEIVVQPWNYWDQSEEPIKNFVKKYSVEKDTPFVLGAGQSYKHFNGCIGSARHWCRAGNGVSNCIGVNLCLWEGNSIHRYLPTIYGGSHYAWNPNADEVPEQNDQFHEVWNGKFYTRLLSWQTLFKDANETDIIKDRGPGVYRGFYIDGPKAGKPIAETSWLKTPEKQKQTEMAD